MSEMIEKVARAICIAAGGDPDSFVSGLPDPFVQRWKLHEQQAISAIRAMRSANFQMKIAGRDGLEEVGIDDVELGHITSAYISMIDSALSNSLPLTPEASKPADSANPPPVESVGPNSEAQS